MTRRQAEITYRKETMKIKTVIAVMSVFGAAAASAGPVKASSFGYDPEDATRCLQAAFDSGAKDILIDRQAGDWISGPVFIRSNQRVTLDAGVVIRAKEGAFPGRFDSLVSISNATGVVLRGRKGSALVMNKPEYQDPSRCRLGEWRHALNLWHATDVKAGGFTAASSGGDGIYVRNVKNVRLERIVCEDNLRQGISVIGAEGLFVKDCVFRTTWGAAPQCGVDIEPNSASEKLIDIVFEDCVFERNRSAGIDLHLANQRSRSTPMSIVFRRCISRDNTGGGIMSYIGRGDPPTGTILFEDCRVRSPSGHALSLRNMFENGPVMVFRNCEFDGRGSKRAAVHFNVNDILDDFCNVEFENCRAFADSGVKAVMFPSNSGAGMGKGMKGVLTVTTGDEKSTVDIAEFARNHPPNRDIIDFKTRHFEYRDLVPQGTALGKEPARNVWMRGDVTFVQHFPGAGEWPIVIDTLRIARGKMSIPVKMRDMQSTDLGDFELTEKSTNFVVRTRGRAVIRFEASAGRNAVSFRSRWPGQGYLVNALTRTYRSGGALFSFFQPESSGMTVVDIRPEEDVAVDIVSPSGALAGRMPKGGYPKLFKVPAENGEWRLKVQSSDEDFSFRIGAPALPLVSVCPGMGFRTR